MKEATAAAFLSTGLISLAPNILLFMFPNYGSSGHNDSGRAVLSIGQALAVGGLVGDVFLHTLPECFADSSGGNHIGEHHHHHEPHHHEPHHHEHEPHHHGDGGVTGLRVILGFAAFLMLDIMVRSLENSSGGGHSHGRSVSVETKNGEIDARNGTADEKNKNGTQPWRRFLSSAILLNLLGDSLHNFTDGLAIGASFSISQIPDTHNHSSLATVLHLMKSRGGLASISVFLHEIPHELGDFATLVKAGLSRNMAIGAQFCTAIPAFMGTAFGLFSGQIVEGLGHEIVLPFTAGGFLYLACVTILPDVLETEASVLMRLLQVSSFLLGVGFMYAVAQLEEMEASRDEDHHHINEHHHHNHDHHEL